MSNFMDGGKLTYDETWRFWMHPDGGMELLDPAIEAKEFEKALHRKLSAEEGDRLLQEQNALLRAVLEAPRIPASVFFDAIRGDKDDGD